MRVAGCRSGASKYFLRHRKAVKGRATGLEARDKWWCVQPAHRTKTKLSVCTGVAVGLEGGSGLRGGARVDIEQQQATKIIAFALASSRFDIFLEVLDTNANV